MFVCWGKFWEFVCVDKLQLHPGWSILDNFLMELSLLDDSAVCFWVWPGAYLARATLRHKNVSGCNVTMDKKLQFQIHQTTGYLPGVAQQSWGHFTGENFMLANDKQ